MLKISLQIFFLLTLGLLPQGLFALDMSEEVESFDILWFSNLEDSHPKIVSQQDSLVQFHYYHAPTIPGLYRSQLLKIRTIQDGVGFSLSRNFTELQVEVENAEFRERSPEWDFQLGVPIWKNQNIDLQYRLQYNSDVGHGLVFGFPQWGILLEPSWARQEYDARFEVAGDELQLKWAYEVYGIGASWEDCFGWGCTRLSYQLKNGNPRAIQSEIESNHDFLKNSLEWSWAFQDWKLRGEWFKSSHSMSLSGDEYDRNFLNADLSLMHTQQTILWKWLGAQAAYWEIESPTPDPRWSVAPSSYPKEGLDSFWFIQSNEFLRWSFLARMSWVSAIFHPQFEGRNWSLSTPMKLGRLFYNIQELKETHSRWLIFVPLRESFVSQNTGNSYQDILNLGIQYGYSWRQWELSVEIGQVVPLYHSEGQVDVIKVVNQEEQEVDPNLSPSEQLNQGQTDLALQSDGAQFGDGLMVNLQINYHF